MDLFDAAVERLANDDYNHIPETVLRERLLMIRGTHSETFLEERADEFLAYVRQVLTRTGDPEYGP